MVFTGKGDDGTTGLLGEGRISKYDLRMEALGTLDEASAALGLARSLLKDPDLAQLLLDIQRELYQLMAEVAASSENAARFRTIGAESVEALEDQINLLSSRTTIPQEFIIPGDSPDAAAISLSRTIVRRAERRVVELYTQGKVDNPAVLAYLNRLSSLLFMLELTAVSQSGSDTPTLAKGG